jgi:hypothetical protein
MKYGLEKEFFVTNPENQIIGPLGPEFTPDECGFLAEARGQPCANIREAVFSLQADIYRLQCAVTPPVSQLVDEPLREVPRSVLLACRRKFSKGTLDYQNLYGYQEHRHKNKKTAGIHISFSCEVPKYNREGHDVGTIKTMFDWVQIFRKLDKAFKEEIKAAGRYPGFYELKQDGRIEYRSLPADCNLFKIIEVLS